MASKVKKLFRKKDGYYEGPDLLSTTRLPARDPQFLLERTLHRPDERPGQYWQGLDIEPPAAFAPNRPPRPSSSPNRLQPGPFRQQFALPSGYKPASRLASSNTSLPSPDLLSPTSASSPDNPFFPRRRTHHVDLFDAASTSQRSNSSLSYHMPRTSRYNEEIADRNGAEGIALGTGAFGPGSSSTKYQEHVADRNLQFGAGEYEKSLEREETLSMLNGHVDTASLGSKVTSPERPGISYSAAEMYKPPPPPSRVLKDPRVDTAEMPLQRTNSNLSSRFARDRRLVHQNKSVHQKKSLPDMATNPVDHDQNNEAVGLAISTDQTYTQRPYYLTRASDNRDLSRIVLDLTDDCNLVEISLMLRTAHNNMAQGSPPPSQGSTSIYRPSELSQNASVTYKHQPKNSRSQSDSKTIPFNPASNLRYDGEDDTTPRPAYSRSSRNEPASRDLSRPRSVDMLRKKRSGKFSFGGMTYSNEDPQMLDSPARSPKKSSARYPRPNQDADLSEAGPSTPSRARPHFSDAADPIPIPRGTPSHRREPTNFSIKSTPQPHALHYTPEGSLYNDSTLLLPGLDNSQIDGDDAFTLVSAGSPIANSAKFDEMIDSFNGEVTQGQRKVYSVPPFRVPKRDSSLNATVIGV